MHRAGPAHLSFIHPNQRETERTCTSHIAHNPAAQHVKKRNFTKCKIKVLITEVEEKRNISFDGLNSLITNKRKTD